LPKIPSETSLEIIQQALIFSRLQSLNSSYQTIPHRTQKRSRTFLLLLPNPSI
jgi:hypothetical protein